MRKITFILPGLALALFLFCSPGAVAAQKNVSLADFNGTWRLDAEKSKDSTKEAANKLSALTGFKFTVNAKAGSIRMEWSDHPPKTRKITASKAEGRTLSCTLEGYKAPMLLEKTPDGQVLVKDRDETLVFVRVPAAAKAAK